MPHTYTSMMVHIVFSTKDRRSLLVPTLEERLYPYFGGILREMESSKWIHETFPDRSSFAWQRGYAAFSVSESQAARVATYIARQKVHHGKVSFRDEFRRLLNAHGISPDEKYLWT